MSGEAPKYGEWQPIETAPRDGTPIIAQFTDEFLSRDENSRCAPCAIVRFQYASPSGSPDWTTFSLAGPFGQGFSMSDLKAWTLLPEPPA